MIDLTKLSKLSLAVFAVFTFVTPSILAQESDENVEEVVVTGTRISNPNIMSTSQVQVVTAADIENRGAS
jgi:outer membrane cobalamin receptor